MVGNIVSYANYGSAEGELRPGLSGWMCWDAEVLELLAFWKPEQQNV